MVTHYYGNAIFLENSFSLLYLFMLEYAFYVYIW